MFHHPAVPILRLGTAPKRLVYQNLALQLTADMDLQIPLAWTITVLILSSGRTRSTLGHRHTNPEQEGMTSSFLPGFPPVRYLNPECEKSINFEKPSSLRHDSRFLDFPFWKIVVS